MADKTILSRRAMIAWVRWSATHNLHERECCETTKTLFRALDDLPGAYTIDELRAIDATLSALDKIKAIEETLRGQGRLP